MSSDVKAHLIIALASIVLTVVAALVAGRVGANATLRAVHTYGATPNRARSAREEQERRAALDDLAHELRLNGAHAGAPQLDDVWMPFQRDALRQAEPHLASLPGYARHAIQRAVRAMAHYDALATHVNQRTTVAARAPAGQGGRGQGQMSDMRSEPEPSLEGLAREAKVTLLGAAEDLEAALAARKR